MLNISFKNITDLTEEDQFKACSYDVEVYSNNYRIYKCTIHNHIRAEGWPELIKKLNLHINK